MDGWMDGRESRVKDCLQQSKMPTSECNRVQNLDRFFLNPGHSSIFRGNQSRSISIYRGKRKRSKEERGRGSVKMDAEKKRWHHFFRKSFPGFLYHPSIHLSFHQNRFYLITYFNLNSLKIFNANPHHFQFQNLYNWKIYNFL